MTGHKALYLRVHDKAGNEFICPLEALKDPKTATEEELDQCVDDATVGGYAGNIRIVETKYRVNSAEFACGACVHLLKFRTPL